MAVKKCTKCCAVKPHADFTGHKQTKDKLQAWCKACCADYRKKYAIHSADKKKAASDRWLNANRERVNELSRIRRKRDPEKTRLVGIRNAKRQAEWVANNRHLVNAALRRWKQKNWPAVLMDCRERRAAKIKAVPAWANKAAILEIYKAAVERGLTVDHIVPLRSKLVCGLHVEANLQLLPATENFKKNNKYWPDMP